MIKQLRALLICANGVIAASYLLLFAVFSKPAMSEGKPVKNRVVSDLGYEVTFPKACKVKKGAEAHISLCAPLLKKQSEKLLPANLPLFMVFHEPLNPKTVRPSSVKTVTHDAARIVCGSEQELAQMKIKTIEAETFNQGIIYKLTIICPADDYGVIPHRKGYYLQSTIKTNRYHLFSRFLLSQTNELNTPAKEFMNSFEFSQIKKPHH